MHCILAGAHQKLDSTLRAFAANFDGREVRHLLYHGIKYRIGVAAKTNKRKLLLIGNILLIAHGAHTSHDFLDLLKSCKERCFIFVHSKVRRRGCGHYALAVLALIDMLPQFLCDERHEGVYQFEQTVKKTECSLIANLIDGVLVSRLNHLQIPTGEFIGEELEHGHQSLVEAVFAIEII